MKDKVPAIVFGMFETGLGVIRSLGENGIPVLSIDYKKDIAFYSRYAKPLICPHPANEAELLNWLKKRFLNGSIKYPVFITGDDFLNFVNRNRKELNLFLQIEIPEKELLQSISNKYQQYLLAKNCNVSVPKTWTICNTEEILNFNSEFKTYPLFVKGLDVNSWRNRFGGTKKGFVVNNENDLSTLFAKFSFTEVPVIVQELIEGPDTNHVKYCAYIDKSGNCLAEFMLQKIRQQPIRFGVGSAVKSIFDEKLLIEGRKLFQGIGYRGVGSAEFKWDEKSGFYKLIELNPRYWQQNYLATFCRMNFPLIQYYSMIGKPKKMVGNYDLGKLWVNRYMDFTAFSDYRKEGLLTFSQWRNSLKGKKVYPDASWRDPLPFFYEFGFGEKLIKIPKFLFRKLFK